MRASHLFGLCLLVAALTWSGCVKPPPTYPIAAQPPVPQQSPELTPPAAPEPASNALAVEAPEPEEVGSAEELTVTEEKPVPAPAAKGEARPSGELRSPSTDAEEEDATANLPAAPPRAGAGAVGAQAGIGRGVQHRRTLRARRQPRVASAPPTKRSAPTRKVVARKVPEGPWPDSGRYPWASEIPLSPELLKGYSDQELATMAREIEARRGKRFSDPRVQAQLDKEKWYYGDDKYTPARLSPTEKRNLELIERIRAHSASRKPKGQDPALDDRSGDAPVDERGEASRRDAAQEP